MNILQTTAIAASVTLAFVASASAATIFTDGTAFDAAVTDTTIETFDARIVGPTVFNPNTAVTFAGGITSTATSNQQFNEVRNGAFVGGTRAGRTNDFDQIITFDFGRDVTAFGGLFTGASNIQVSGVFDGVANTFLIGDSRTDNGFFGLTSTTAFRTVSFSTDTGGFLPFGNPTVSLQAINFGLDDLTIGTAVVAAPAPVPLPASALLLLGAVGGLGGLRKLLRRA